MRTVTIIQIGAGGTGSWFARTLAHGIASRLAKTPHGDIHPFTEGLLLSWKILDPDTIEVRNQARQLFLGAEALGVMKSEYLSRMVTMILHAGTQVPDIEDITFKYSVIGHPTLVQQLENVPDYTRFTSAGPDDQYLLVSCVDNTFTRTNLETALLWMREDPIMEDRAPNHVLYVDMGVTENSEWAVTGTLWRDLVKTKYSRLTYPDAMLSCAERQERGISPQTTFANACAGIHASQVALEYICNPEPFFGAFIVGAGHNVRNLATDKRTFLQMQEDVQK